MQQEVGDDQVDVADDHRSDTQLSGGGSILARLVMDRPGLLNETNLYVAGKSAFKPAAPNLSEAEDAHILEPERVVSWEIGLKSRFLEHQLSLELSAFKMDFKNVVVSIAGADGLPELTNAGKTRFQGFESEIGYHPCWLPAFSLYGGYAHHDARYVNFSFIDPDEGLLVADGQRFELTPRDLWNAMISFHPDGGTGSVLRRPPPEPSPVRQDQRGLHAVVLRVRRRRLLHVRDRAGQSRRAQPRGQPALRVGERDRRRAALRRATAALHGRAGLPFLTSRRVESAKKKRPVRTEGRTGL